MPFKFLKNRDRGNSFISDNVSGKQQSYRARVYGTPIVPSGFTAFVDPQGIVVPTSVVRAGPGAPGSTETLIFTSTQPITIPSPISMEYLIVAGGGASGSESYPWGGGGGGAGGYRTGTTPVTSGTYTVTVGAGGPATPGAASNRKGADSSFNSITSTGGGGGGGGAGGSGGGSGNAGGSTGSGSGNSPPTTPPQGNPGFGSNSGPGDGGGGGGAGSGGPGTSVNGGSGLLSPLSPASYGSPAGYFAGGGGSGGGTPSNPGPGGAGGGGQGGPGGASAGTENTGGGGGQPLKNGGSGIVILKYNT